MPIIAPLSTLEVPELMKIISEPKNAILRQYQKMLEMDGVELEFRDDAVKEIAQKAFKEKTGARGLRSIIETMMLEIMYEIPDHKDIEKCIITKNVVEGTGKPKLIKKKVIA